ncbi:MAG: N,N-dimethylformamidase beta subunit family domain-containing protein, partial [Pseudomonadota bacterium]
VGGMPHRFSLEDVNQGHRLSPTAGWEFFVGNFASQGLADLAAYRPDEGSLWVLRNNGGGFVPELFNERNPLSPVSGWQIVPGRFSQSARSELAAYHPGFGTVWVLSSDGERFSYENWSKTGPLDPVDGWSIFSGNFTGAERDDLAAYHPSNGTLWLLQNMGDHFLPQRWDRGEGLRPRGGWQFVTAEVDGSGRSDLIGYHDATGVIWNFSNNADHFLGVGWGALPNDRDWQLTSWRYGSPDHSDIMAYDRRSGRLAVAFNTGQPFAPIETETIVSPAEGWQFLSGHFRPNLRGQAQATESILGYHPSNGSLWLFHGEFVNEGYAWPRSAAPGQTVQFMVSSVDGGEATIERYTASRHINHHTTGHPKAFPVIAQATKVDPWKNGCGWEPSFDLVIGENWKSGIYAARLNDERRQDTFMPFIVRPSDDQPKAPIAVLANVNTWNAYNGWGGFSRYDRKAHGSFLRPDPGASPTASNSHLMKAEMWVNGWLERAGFDVDYYTDIDLHDGTLVLDDYRCLIVQTHPEYWSTAMYDRVHRYLFRSGGSMLYLGGNGAFEVVEYTPDKTSLIYTSGIDDGPRDRSLFRSNGRHEIGILGVATADCNVVPMPYRVVDPDHPFMQPLSLGRGDKFGEESLNTFRVLTSDPEKQSLNGASGWETDRSTGLGVSFSNAGRGAAEGLPGFSGGGDQCSVRAYGGLTGPELSPPTLPRGHRVLARADNVEIDGRVSYGAELVTFETSRSGFVLSAGSVMFGGAIPIDTKIQTLLRTALASIGVTPNSTRA